MTGHSITQQEPKHPVTGHFCRARVDALTNSKVFCRFVTWAAFKSMVLLRGAHCALLSLRDIRHSVAAVPLFSTPHWSYWRLFRRWDKMSTQANFVPHPTLISVSIHGLYFIHVHCSFHIASRWTPSCEFKTFSRTNITKKVGVRRPALLISRR